MRRWVFFVIEDLTIIVIKHEKFCWKDFGHPWLNLKIDHRRSRGDEIRNSLLCRDFVIKQSGHSNPFLLFRCTVLARTVSFMALLSMSQWIAHLICSRIFIAFIRIWNHLYECDKSKEFFYNTCQRLSVRTFPRSIDDVVQFLIVRYLRLFDQVREYIDIRLFWKDNYWQETSRTQRRITY